MAADLHRLRRALIALLSRDADAGVLAAGLAAADWSAIDEMAACHRLQPMLHALHGGKSAIPDDIRSCWRAASRLSAMQAMAQRADLDDTVKLLRGHGYEPLALKGAWLAWQAYPSAALRPMRDIDLLLPGDQFLPAFEALQAAGYEQTRQGVLSVEGVLAIDKSLPELTAPRGTPFELHLHAWLPDGRLDYPSPPPDDAGLFARARRGPDGILYPSATDMLAHLIIHAVYSHRLDCGPLFLFDIEYLLAREEIDWTGFWTRAAQGRWLRGARIVLSAVEQLRGLPGIDWQGHAPGPELEPLLDDLPDLMLQDLSTRLSAGLAARLGGAGGARPIWSKLRNTVTGRISTVGGVSAGREFAGAGEYAAWAWSRLTRTAGDLSRRAVRDQARSIARFTALIREPD